MTPGPDKLAPRRPTDWPVRLSCRVYGLLLAAFPRRFRARFGPEIASTFAQLVAGAWIDGGARGLLRLWARTAVDLFHHAGGQRVGNRTLVVRPRRRRSGLLESTVQDVSFAIRTLGRAPGFTVAVVATVALGIGANTAIFTVVNGILLRPLPFSGSERVVILCETREPVAGYCTASPPNVRDWAQSSSMIERFGLARSWIFGLDEPDGTRNLSAGVATPGWFDVQALSPAVGRLLAPADLEPGGNRVVVLSHALWQTRFGADPGVVGSAMVLDGGPFTVIGVLPGDAWIHDFGSSEIWVPLTAIQDDVEDRDWRGFVALGRLAEGATLSGARDEMEAIRAALEIDYPDVNGGWELSVELLRNRVTGPVRSILLVFLGAVGLVLLIACANVANLLLVRSTTRRQEFAVRASLGAGRSRLARQLLTESAMLAVSGGVIGVLLALWTTQGFVALAPQSVPRLGEVRLDASVLLVALALTVATAALFGLAPAVGVARSELSETLKSKRTVDRRGLDRRNLLVIAELALAVTLLFGAVLLTRGFTTLLNWDPGFDRAGLVAFWALAPPAKYETGAQAVDLFERAADELRAIPGVEAVGTTSAGPLFGGIETEQFQIAGRPETSAEERPSARYYDIGTGYFDALGSPLVRGRDFELTDSADSVPVVIVNEALAQRHFAGEEALGQRLELFDRAWEIVGVARDLRPFRPDEAVAPEIYVPKRQFPRWGGYFVLRTGTGGAPGLQDTARARLLELDRDFDPGSLRSIDELAGRELVSPRFNMLLTSMFAVVALVLAAIGTYGVIAYTVASRTHEIGIRMALGARPRAIRLAVIRHGAGVTGAGLLLGIAGGLALSRLLGSLVYGVSPADPLTLTAVVAVFAAVALAACWIPSHRASKVDPLLALRAD